jgi:BMFP domain-containing protein YqiC
MDKQFFDDLASKISATLPPMPGSVSKELEQSLRGVLHNAFDKLELVTREDFEIQSAVLQKTRLKLELLEKRLAELEEKMNVN